MKDPEKPVDTCAVCFQVVSKYALVRVRLTGSIVSENYVCMHCARRTYSELQRMIGKAAAR